MAGSPREAWARANLLGVCPFARPLRESWAPHPRQQGGVEAGRLKPYVGASCGVDHLLQSIDSESLASFCCLTHVSLFRASLKQGDLEMALPAQAIHTYASPAACRAWHPPLHISSLPHCDLPVILLRSDSIQRTSLRICSCSFIPEKLDQQKGPCVRSG